MVQRRSRKARWPLGLGLVLISLLGPKAAPAAGLADLLQIGSALMVHVGVHESGHHILARMGGAEEVDLSFLTQQGKTFFLGLSKARGLDKKYTAAYKMAGEVAVSHHFEFMLEKYRRRPTTYNRAMLFFTGGDFLIYSLYAFYLNGSQSPDLDPVGFSQEAGIPPEAVVGMAALQSALNAYRVYSGSDTLAPYLAMDQESVSFGLRWTF